MASTNFKFLDPIINKKNPDHVRIRYYPSCDNQKANNTNTLSDNKMTQKSCIDTVTIIKDICDEDMSKLKTCSYASGTFTEYGIKDTFIRVSVTDNNRGSGNSRMFFRRELQMFKAVTFPGIFVIELFKMCEEEDLPHIINYQHNTDYYATTYTVEKDSGDLRICFTKIKNQKSDQYVSFMDINRDLDIVTDSSNFLMISKSVTEFLDDVSSLRNKLKINI